MVKVCMKVRKWWQNCNFGWINPLICCPVHISDVWCFRPSEDLWIIRLYQSGQNRRVSRHYLQRSLTARALKDSSSRTSGRTLDDAEDSSSLFSGSWTGASVTKESESESVTPLPEPEPLLSSSDTETKISKFANIQTRLPRKPHQRVFDQHYSRFKSIIPKNKRVKYKTQLKI